MVTEPGLSWGWRKKGLQQIQVWACRPAPEVSPFTSLMDVVLECRASLYPPTLVSWSGLGRTHCHFWHLLITAIQVEAREAWAEGTLGHFPSSPEAQGASCPGVGQLGRKLEPNAG